MNLNDVLMWSGSGVVLVLSFIKLPKVEINIWGLLAKAIGKAINGDISQKIDKIDTNVSILENKMTSMEKTLNDHVLENKLDSIRNTRSRILRFHDELRHGVQHTEEHYNEVLSDIDIYEDFCDKNKDYPNTKAEVAICGIKENYKKCIGNNSFLK